MMQRADYVNLTQQTARAVARELYECRYIVTEHRHAARFEHEPTGFMFGWHCRGYGSEAQARRMHVSAIAPDGVVAGRRAWLPDGPTMSFDPYRPPKDIANELRRRFIAPWLALWPQVEARRTGEVIAYDACETLLADLMKLTNGTQIKHFRGAHMMCATVHRTGGDETWLNEVYFEGHVFSGDRVDLKLTNLSAKTAMAVAKLVKECEPK